MFNVAGYGGSLLGKANAAANTVVYAVVPGHSQGFARVTGFQYAAGNTANDFTFMRPIGRSAISAAATTSDAAVTLATDPSASGNTIAAGDQVVLGPCTDSTYRRAQVNTSGWNSTTKVLTFTANLAANVNTSTKLFNFGVPADTDPSTGLAHPVFTPVANTVTTVDLPAGGFRGGQKGDPLLIYNVNATNATVLNFAGFGYTMD